VDVGGRDCERQGPPMSAEGHRFKFFCHTTKYKPNCTSTQSHILHFV
jgi:hypothetical protein